MTARFHEYLFLFSGLILRDGYSPSTSQRYLYPLHARPNAAYLCAESTIYHLDASKLWFKACVDDILSMYGTEHESFSEGGLTSGYLFRCCRQS